MLIRPAVPDDARALAELGAATFAETFGHLYSAENLRAHLARVHSQAQHLALLNDPHSAVWLAVDDARHAIGYAVAGACRLPVDNLEANAGELKQIYVRASHQQHRLGSKLMNAALEWLEQRYSPLYVGVWEENLGAQRLYERYGFARIGEYRFQVGDHFDRDFILKRPQEWRAAAPSP